MKTNRFESALSSAVLSSAIALVLLASARNVHAAQWTPLTNPSPSPSGTMMLLTDGTVMVQGNPLNTWMRLTPSAKGSYADGSWSPLASMSIPRLYFASQILPNGNVWVLGGEYSGTSLQENITNTGEVYDSVSDTWSPIASHPEAHFGDDPSMLLSKGKILAGSIFTNRTYLYDIQTNTWSFAASKAYPDRSDEESWVELPNGKVMTYDIFESVDQSGQYAELYDPATKTWTSISPSDGSAAGSIPELSSVAVGYELGPLLRLPGNGEEGRIFAIGATGHTALYSPSSNTWAHGPDITGVLGGNPADFGAADAPAAVMSTGHVLLAADASPTLGLFSPPTQLFDFDPVSNTISPVSPAIPDSNLTYTPSFRTRMLVLPTGEILFSDGSSQLWIYKPDGHADPSSLPVIDKVKYSGAGVFTLRGERMNGSSAGSAYGDDVQSDENYPIVRLEGSTGHVFYARTTNWSSTLVGTGAGRESVDFTLKPGMAPGNYSIIVSGAGVSSRPRCVTITADQIQGTDSDSEDEISCREQE
jgi:Kelch motif